MVSNAHHVVAQKAFFILDLAEQRLKGVTGIKGSNWVALQWTTGMCRKHFLHQLPRL